MVVAVGRVREKHWRAAQEDYEKRLGRYVDFQSVDVKDSVGSGAPDLAALRQEGERMLAAVKGVRRLIALTPEGDAFTSPAFASFLRKQIETYGRLAFLIGGPLGLSGQALDACQERVSLSPMTFPHEMARVVLMEQLYRSATLLSGEKYHK